MFSHRFAFSDTDWDNLFDWGWFWGGEPRRRGRGRRRRHQWFESGDMKYVILRVLEDKPMHGYEVMKALEEQTRGCYKPSPGTVYPTLQWLEDEGLVDASNETGKKIYTITDAGRAFLEENRSSVDDIFERVEEMIDAITGDAMPDVNRTVGRLVTQVYRASWRLRHDQAKRERIAQILTDALNELETL